MANEPSSRIAQFFAKTLCERVEIVAERSGFTKEERSVYQGADGLSLNDADEMIENAIGVYGLPVGVAVNFVVDGEPVLVPMVVEEPSVIAAASHMAKLVALNGGFKTNVDASIMLGQIQVIGISNMDFAVTQVAKEKDALMAKINLVLHRLVERGGGCIDVQSRILPSRKQNAQDSDFSQAFLVVELVIDCKDAMGANLVNTAVESISDDIARITNGNIVFRILTNLCDRRLARAYCELPFRALASDACGDNGEKVARSICLGYELAMRDPYRAATHNKGIMNGIDSVAIATGNDWRAIEAGAHAYAVRDGQYRSLSHYKIVKERSALSCSIELPLAVGVVGGATSAHKVARANLKMLGSFGMSSRKLAGLMASVGLAQNMGAMRALAAEGIQKGHMALHHRKREYHAHRF